MTFRTLSHIVGAVALAAVLPATAFAQDEASAEAASITPQVKSRDLSGTFGGQRINYTATIKENVLSSNDGTPEAVIVTTSYVKRPRDTSRPVFFIYNGGPGSGSVWLQMGAWGPKRVAIPSDARDDGAPPYPILDNPESLLDVADLVFIDPPGTGFSYLTDEGDPEKYYGLEQDARAVATVIRRWINDNGRWNSPKYLGGESYGTTRTAMVVRELEGATYNDVGLNGLILVSTILDFAAREPTPGNEMAYVMALPNMATAAYYYGKATAPSVEAIAEEARKFAIGPYVTALLKGQDLSAAERAIVRAELARLTGLSETYLDQAELRVTPQRFYKELLRDRGLTIGRLDSRYTGTDYDDAGESPDNDPSFYGIDAGYTAAINSWARDTLGFETDREYQAIGSDPGRNWDWTLSGRGRGAYLNVAPFIGDAMRQNSQLRTFVGQGWYDFATPFFGAEYSLNRIGIPQDRVEFHYYDAGHMMYIRDEDRAKLSADIRAFIRNR
ncbi:S10 family peptidase [Alteriqipengyuania lutimaris]|uniref:Peptidase S10 n=1 Tax=Alteriqipengyuania lutimaris TaxID=1538146 RepID=A0A395LJH9_9SPHN|nr:peptidase S10 [Alteriqipengyuania lutimaris]MBB3033912.1 carboxypeptidase C (cathepsin A) [Alteriqipengyuania lutimaris]RDS77128.1 peptidase S10 [Alteriqipengyuania lutimaris]